MARGNGGVHRLHLFEALFHLLPNLFQVAINGGCSPSKASSERLRASAKLVLRVFSRSVYFLTVHSASSMSAVTAAVSVTLLALDKREKFALVVLGSENVHGFLS